MLVTRFGESFLDLREYNRLRKDQIIKVFKSTRASGREDFRDSLSRETRTLRIVKPAKLRRDIWYDHMSMGGGSRAIWDRLNLLYAGESCVFRVFHYPIVGVLAEPPKNSWANRIEVYPISFTPDYLHHHDEEWDWLNIWEGLDNYEA